MTAALLIALAALGHEPVRWHPDNARYLEFRGRPLVVVTACEHDGSVINRLFDFQAYLDDAARQRMTLTRTFVLYRELQTARNPWSPCKPESPDYLAPWPRTGPGRALDGEPRYDLDQWNPEFFERLRHFLQAASDRGIVVELCLFSHTYNDSIWALNPLKAENNRQEVGKVAWPDYDSLKEPALVSRQEALARKIVAETCDFDNLYYEVCNEPAGGRPQHATVADVDAWLTRLAGVVRNELQQRRRSHLVFGTRAFDIPQLRQEFEGAGHGPNWDGLVVHPHPHLRWGTRDYDLGDFMSKQLRLGPLRDFCLATGNARKPVVLDEDNAASMYRTPAGWLIHRKRAWTTVLSGCHYNMIDFSITVGREQGTPASRRGLRAPFRHLSTTIHSFDVIQAQPDRSWLGDLPASVVASALAIPGRDYLAYFADAREGDSAHAGERLAFALQVKLPPGRYRVRLIGPATGQASPAWMVTGGEPVSLDLEFHDDLALRVTRIEG